MPLVKAIQEVVGQAGFVSGDVGGFVGVGVEVGEVDFVVVEIEFVAVVLDGLGWFWDGLGWFGLVWDDLG